MDPISITTSVIALAKVCSQVVILCSNVAYKQKTFRRTLAALRTETSSYQHSLHQIQDLLLDQTGPLASFLGSNDEWVESFVTGLSACSMTMSILAAELQKAAADSSGSSIGYMLREQDLKDLMGELRGQQGGIQLLIQTLQLKSTAEILRLLNEKREILNHVKQQTTSLSETWGIQPIQSTGLRSDTFSIITMDLDDKRFDFDEDLSRMGPYRRALRAQIQQREQLHITLNLIDEDLMDLSIDPLTPGRWTGELQREFSVASIQASSSASKTLDESTEKDTPPALQRSPSPDNAKDTLAISWSEPSSIERPISDSNLQADDAVRNPDQAVVEPIPPALQRPPSSDDVKDTVAIESPELSSIDRSRNDFDLQVDDAVRNPGQVEREASPKRSVSSNTASIIKAKDAGTSIASSSTGRFISSRNTDFDFVIVGAEMVPEYCKPLDFGEDVKMTDLARSHYAASIGAPIIKPHGSRSGKEAKRFIFSTYEKWTLLEVAAQNGNFVNLQNILSNAQSSWFLKSHGDTLLTALDWAAIMGNAKAVKLLLNWFNPKDHCSLRCRFGDSRTIIFPGWTPLSLAAFFGHVSVVKTILQERPALKTFYVMPSLNRSSQLLKGILGDAANWKGRLIHPFHATLYSIRYALIFSNTIPYFDNFNIGIQMSNLGRNLLGTPDLRDLRRDVEDLWISQSEKTVPIGTSLELLELLQFSRRDLDAKDYIGCTALHIAACGAHPDVVKRLLELGSGSRKPHRNISFSETMLGLDPNTDSWTPLQLAAFWNRETITRTLIQNGVDPSQRGSWNLTPLHCAAATGSLEVVKYLLQQLGSKTDIDVLGEVGRDEYQTPLSIAFKYQQWECAKAILEAVDTSALLYPDTKKDIYDETRRDCQTILHFVVKASGSPMVPALKILLEHGVSPDVRDLQQYTALHMLVFEPPTENTLQAMELLIKHGADINAIGGPELCTPLYHALQTSKVEANGKHYAVNNFIRSLLASSADPSVKNKRGENVLSRLEHALSESERMLGDEKRYDTWTRAKRLKHDKSLRAVTDLLNLLKLMKASVPEDSAVKSSS